MPHHLKGYIEKESDYSYFEKDGEPQDFHFCEHMKALNEFAKTNKLSLSSCGDCDSIWFVCDQCKLDVHHADIGADSGEEV